MRKLENILVTGGAGFIGANFIHFLFDKVKFSGRIINYDALTYAGNVENLEEFKDWDNYEFVHGNILDTKLLDETIKKYEIDTIVHFAAESHVDRSISSPNIFIKTNVLGTFNLLNAAKNYWGNRNDVIFHHVSTDEVYGSLGKEGFFYENTPYSPRSPYSASKASSDHIVRSYFHTYNFPVTISNCSNNYGPYQFPEKLIPLMVLNMIEGKELPIYGNGKNIRDWLFVEDHCNAIWLILNNGRLGETYNIGGENEWENLKLVETLCEIVAEHTNKEEGFYKKLITFVKDRPGHDLRYAINCDKIKKELSWKHTLSFSEGLEKTVIWYLDNPKWIENIKTGEYKKWIKDNYGS